MRLHPDLVGIGGGQIVAETGRVEALAVGDHEPAAGAEFLERGADLLGLGDGQIGAADAQHHALHARVALRGVERQHGVHHRHGMGFEVEGGVHGVRHGAAQVQRQHHVSRKAVAPRQADHDHDDDEEQAEDHEPRDSVQNARSDGPGPAQECDHVQPFRKTRQTPLYGRGIKEGQGRYGEIRDRLIHLREKG